MPKNPANLHRTSSTGSAATAPPREVWSVSRLNLEVRALIDSGLGHVWIEGEISNFIEIPIAKMKLTQNEFLPMVKEAFQLENGPIGGIYSSPSNIEIGPEDILFAG